MTRREYQKILTESALAQGALQVEPFEMDDLLFDQRTWLKCIFACEGDKAEPGDLELRQRMLREFSWGVLLRAQDAASAARIAMELERSAMREGYYFAFSIGECGPCAEGTFRRPGFYGMGIDLIATARRLEMPISYQHTIPGTQQEGYAALFVE